MKYQIESGCTPLRPGRGRPRRQSGRACLEASRRDTPDAKAGRVFQEYLEKIEAIPGVEAAATVTGPPLRPARGGNAELVGVVDSTGAPRSVIAWNHQISPDYFRTLRIPLLAGRAFRPSDAGPNINVAIVNEEFARRFGLGVDVVGKQMPDAVSPLAARALMRTPAPG